jgi:hypothetical protein
VSAQERTPQTVSSQVISAVSNLPSISIDISLFKTLHKPLRNLTSEGQRGLRAAIWTVRRTGLVVGGMPIVTPWAFGIIVFEMIALGAILASVGRMIYEAGLMRRNKLPKYDDLLAAGNVVLAVECSEADARGEAGTVLAATNARLLESD